MVKTTSYAHADSIIKGLQARLHRMARMPRKSDQDFEEMEQLHKALEEYEDEREEWRIAADEV